LSKEKYYSEVSQFHHKLENIAAGLQLSQIESQKKK